MRVFNLIVTIAWTLLTITSFLEGKYFIGLLEFLITFHTLSDALEAK